MHASSGGVGIPANAILDWHFERRYYLTRNYPEWSILVPLIAIAQAKKIDGAICVS
jgi:hypothetical protein